MKKTKEEKIKVLLTGQGGDETLAGYYKLVPYFLADLFKDAKIRSFFNNLTGFDYGADYSRKRIFLDVLKIVFARIMPSGIKEALKARALPGTGFLDKDFAAQFGSQHRLTRRAKSKSFLAQELYDSIYISPLPGLLHIDDRNSMANSVESRPPLLDHRLVEFVWSLPYDIKMKDGFTKNILREAMKGKLPESVRMRRDKMGFVTPAKFWFRTGMKDYLYGVFDSGEFKKRGIFDTGEVKKALNSHFEGKNDYSFTIWSWLNLELWHRTFIDRSELVK
jgi:asparagine synthase (glutamine-hydrolysing)